MTNNKNKKLENVRFGMPTQIFEDIVTSVGQQNGALRKGENVEISDIEVEGPVTVVSGDVYERITQ